MVKRVQYLENGFQAIVVLHEEEKETKGPTLHTSTTTVPETADLQYCTCSVLSAWSKLEARASSLARIEDRTGDPKEFESKGVKKNWILSVSQCHARARQTKSYLRGLSRKKIGKTNFEFFSHFRTMDRRNSLE